MLMKVLLLNEKCRETNAASGCFVADLRASECRKGCEVCHLNELTANAMKSFCKIEGPGKEYILFANGIRTENVSLIINLDCANATLQALAKILESCGTPEWLVQSENMFELLEYFLFDTIKNGISLHLAGASPCLFYDTDRLLALVRSALG